MHRLLSRLAGLCTLILTVGTLARPALAAPDLTSLADQVFILVNQQRAARGLKPLARVSPLDRSAQDYAGRMATEDFFAHIAPDGQTPAGRILAAGYSWSGWGENIAAGLDTAEAVMDAWMQSPGHAANILSDSYSQIGIGVAVGGTYGIYWVQDFGSPWGDVPGPWVPRLDRLSAATAGAGGLLTLEGADFGSPGGVTFAGIPASVEQWSTSRVSVHVPTGAAGPVVLTNAYGSSNSLAFGTAPPPAPTPGSAPTPTPPAPAPPPATPQPAPPSSTPAPPSSPAPTPPNSTPTPPSSPAPPPPAPPAPTPPALPTPTPPVIAQPSPTSTPAPPSSSTGAPPAAPPLISTPAISSPTPIAEWRSTPVAAGLRFDYVLPNRGPSGTTVHLTGIGFGSATGQVRVNGGTATVLSWSDTDIVVRIEGVTAGQKGVWILRADGGKSPIRRFRMRH